MPAAADPPILPSLATSTTSSSSPSPSILIPVISTPAGRTPEKIASLNTSFTKQFGFEILKISKAPVFDRMFNGNFAEGQKAEAILPEDDPDAFDMFASWLYRGYVTSPCDGFGVHKRRQTPLDNFIRLLIFAEKYGLVGLADNTMDMLIEAQINDKSRPGEKMDAIAYEGTHEGSVLRLYISRSWAYTVLAYKDKEPWASSSIGPIGKKANELLADGLSLLRDLNNVKPLAGKKLIEDPKLAPPCDYHQHGKDEVCPYAKLKKRKLDESN
ncbi:hypothetical protein VTL71DRAFT_7278 [Oculimacula yallundae]|uniref:BTB domain-containing protein n=1 Tax=Oculimacula yallundae TaxID=86028 RepID=A0ABR4BW80_9HELO